MLYRCDCGCVVLAESKDSTTFRIVERCYSDDDQELFLCANVTEGGQQQVISHPLLPHEEMEIFRKLVQLQVDGYRYRDLRKALQL